MSIKRISTAFGLAVAVMIFSVSANAQEDDGGPVTQGEDAKYLSITYVSFKQGQREDAMAMINEYFKPAGDKAGVPGPIMEIHYQTGSWDAAFIWEMDGGMADMEWYRSPGDIKWDAALAEIAGGEEEAGEIWAAYLATVARTLTEVGHHHVAVAE